MVVKRSSYLRLLICLGLAELFFITPLVFSPWATTFTVTKNTAAQLIVLIIFPLWIIYLLESRDYHFLKSSLTLPILAFFLIILISLSRSSSLYDSFKDLARWTTYIAAYFIIISIIREKKWLYLILGAALFAGFLAAAYCIFQFYGIDFPFWAERQRRMRLFSTFGNPNYLSGYLAITLPLAFALFCIEKKKSRQIFLEILIAVLYTGVFITNIGGWIAFVMGILFMGVVLLIHQKNFLRENRLRLLVLILILSIISLIYSSPNPLNPTRRSVAQEGISYTSLECSSTQQRFLIWLSTIQMIKEHPIQGWGIGTFGIHYPFSQEKVLSLKENKKYIPVANKSINTHNDYLHLWSETGIIGLACFLWIVLLFYKKSFKYLKEVKSEDKFLLIGFMGGGTALLVDALFSFPFHIIQNGLLFWGILALSTLISEGTTSDDYNKTNGKVINSRKQAAKLSEFSKIVLRRAVEIGIVCLAIYLGILRVRLFVADTHLKAGKMFMETGIYPAAEQELKKAVKIDSHNGLAYAALGITYAHLGKYEEAIPCFKRAEKNWIYSGLYNDLAYSYLEMGELEKAKKNLKKNIYLFPNSYTAYLNLANIILSEAEKDLSEEKMKSAKKKLDETFICYEQGMVFNRDFLPPVRLAQAYNKIGIDVTEERERSPFLSFFSQGRGAIVDFLPPIAKSGEPIYFKVFLYHPEKLNSFFKGSIEIRNESERLIKTLAIKKEGVSSNNPCLFTVLWKDGIPAGNYTAIVRVRHNRGKVVWRKRDFSIKNS